MKILMLSENDPAGTAILFARALNAHTPHKCRLITTATRYDFDFEKDIHLPDLAPDDDAAWDEVEGLLRCADVFHFHILSDEHMRLGRFTPKDFLDNKAIVHHHHGHPDFRGNPDKYRAKYRRLGRTKILVSTPDLLRLCPEARWQPNLVPVNDPRYTPLPVAERPPYQAGDILRLAHSPTRKDLKNTDELLAAVARLQAQGVALSLDMIENTRHAECLERKRRCHVLFDHLQGYYGMSSLEALSQGLCVISGLDDWNAGHIRDFTGASDLPWVVTDPPRLEQTLADLARDPDQVALAGRNARAFMLEHWNEARAAQRLAAFYEA